MPLNDQAPRRRVLNLTPLIDVVFLLLVFFMLASTFLKFGTVKLDTIGGGGTGNLSTIALIHVGAQHLYRIAGRVVPPGDLETALRAELAGGKTDAVVVLRPDASTADLVAGLSRIRTLGFKSVRVVE